MLTRARTWGLCSFWLVAAACSEPNTSASSRERVATVQAALDDAVNASDDEVAVIVNLRPRTPRPADREARRIENERIQDALLARQHEGFTLSRRFRHVPALAGRITRAALERLRHDPDVAYVQIDSPGGGQLKEAVPAIGADQVKTMYGITGKGVVVAVLDTGVDTTHPDLKDAIVGQHCFTQGDCGLFMNESNTAEDDHGHGSNVAGIVASRGMVSSPGFAPGSSLVAVKVDDQNDSGIESDWVAGLDWVYDNLAMLKVKVVNMSICTNQLFADANACDLGEPALAAATKNLLDAGVVIFSASGNRGSTSSMSAPGCNTGVIAVGAVYDSNVGFQPPQAPTYASLAGSSFADCSDATTMFDQITCFTNSPKRLDLVAPGAPITSDGLMGKTSTYWGTSQASPAAAGVAALMLECDPMLTPDEIKQAMIKTGVPRMDPKSGLSFPSLRALDVVRSVCFEGDAGMPGTGGGGGAGGAGGASPNAGAGGASGITGGSAGASVAGSPASAGHAASAGETSTSAGSAANGEAAARATAGATATEPGVAGTTSGATTIVGTGVGRGAGANSSGCGCEVIGGDRRDLRARAWFALGLVVIGWRMRRLRARRASAYTL